MKLRLSSILIAVSLTATSLFATDFYVSENGAGDGRSCASAHSVAWLNAGNSIQGPTNWGTADGQIHAGDKVHLCGTIATPVTIQGSGTDGRPITLFFEPGAKISAPSYPDGTALISMSNQKFVVIDGGTRSDGTPNGVLEVTDVGSPDRLNPLTGKMFSNQVNIYGVLGNSVSNVTVKNLIVQNLYQRTDFSTTDSSRNGYGIGLTGSTDSTDLLVENNIVHDADTLITIGFDAGQNKNYRITSNRLYRCNHAIQMATGQTKNAFLDGGVISGNKISDMDVWTGDIAPNCTQGCSAHHLDGMILYDESLEYSGGFSNVKIFNNVIGPRAAGNLSNTAAIFVISYKPEENKNMMIFNNLFVAEATEAWSNGFVAAGGQDLLIANNTMISDIMSGKSNSGGALSASGRNVKIYNNLRHNAANGIAFAYSPPDSYTTLSADYNIYYPAPYDGFGINPGGIFPSLESWQKYSPTFDPHSTGNEPLLNANYVPLDKDVVARERGMNLSTYCVQAPELCMDFDGKIRPQLGAWDIGAFQNKSAAPWTPTPKAPDQPTAPGSTSNSGNNPSLTKTIFNPNKGEQATLVVHQNLPGHVTADIFSRSGEAIAHPVNDDFPSGDVIIAWDGRNLRGTVAASGSYVVLIKKADGTVRKKVAIIK